MTETQATQDSTKKTKKKINAYLVILDKSGSMGSVVKQTVSGFNEQVQTIKDLTRKYPDQEFLVSLITFNHNIDIDFFNVDAEKLEEIKEENYLPDGNTALYDAVGTGINKMRNDLKQDLQDEDVQVFVTVFTDGEENSSKEFSHENYAVLMAETKKDKRWVVTYVGTNTDIEATAKRYGTMISNTGSYDGSQIGTQAALRGIGATIRKAAHYRGMGISADDDMMSSLVTDVYKDTYAAEVQNMSQSGLDAKAVWTNMAEKEEEADKKAGEAGKSIKNKKSKK